MTRRVTQSNAYVKGYGEDMEEIANFSSGLESYSKCMMIGITKLCYDEQCWRGRRSVILRHESQKQRFSNESW